MQHQGAKGKNRGVALHAFLFAMLSCALGLSFCFIKSPQSQSRIYLGLAVEAMNNHKAEEAAAAALESVRLNPSFLQGWKILSRTLEQAGNQNAARQALAIAGKLERNEPVYALPAEFKLSLLADAGIETP